MAEKEKEPTVPNWFNNNADWKKMGLDWLNFARTTTQNTIDTLNLWQEQSQKVMQTMMNQGTGIQQDYQKMHKEWTETAKKGVDAYQKVWDNTFKTAENYFKT